MNTYTIQSGQLAALFDQLNQSGRIVIAPVLKKSGKVFFETVKSYNEIATDYIQTAFSAKSVVFPKVEELFSFIKREDGIEISTSIDSIPETIVWGLRPCDAAAFDYLTEFFMRENPDAYFAARKEKTTLISFSCHTCDSSCFCTSVGLTPGSSKGSDVLLTRMGDEIYAESISPRGAELISNTKGVFIESEQKSKESWLATPTTIFSLEEVKEKIRTAYDNVQWKHESMGCYGCGACAFSCPTCTCFDIQDEGTQHKGKRLRCWDSCGFSLFTKHASGHNPRHNQTERRRQRLLHKFKYSVENLGIVSCVGCGRCIRVCPAHLNIFENILQVTSSASNENQTSDKH